MHRPARPATAGGGDGGNRQVQSLPRAASAPLLRRPQSGKAAQPGVPQRPCSAGGLQAYRSKAIELEVRLREQLADAGVQGGDGLKLPPSAALTGQARPGTGDAGGIVTGPKLQVYSDLFEAIIDSDDAFAPLLQKLKAIYDACAEPCLRGESGLRRVAARSLNPDAVGEEDTAAAQDSEHLTELALENRLLRTMAGRLFQERESLRLEREAADAQRRHKEDHCAPDDGQNWAVLGGLLPMGGGIGCQDWLRRKTPQTRPFSAMRITSNGVRTDQRW